MGLTVVESTTTKCAHLPHIRPTRWACFLQMRTLSAGASNHSSPAAAFVGSGVAGVTPGAGVALANRLLIFFGKCTVIHPRLFESSLSWRKVLALVGAGLLIAGHWL